MQKHNKQSAFPVPSRRGGPVFVVEAKGGAKLQCITIIIFRWISISRGKSGEPPQRGLRSQSGRFLYGRTITPTCDFVLSILLHTSRRRNYALEAQFQLVVSWRHFLPNTRLTKYTTKRFRVRSFCQIILLFRVIQSSALWRIHTILI